MPEDNLNNRKHPEDDESELIQQAKTDPEAFGELYERYVKRIYNYIYYRTGNHQDTEDLTARVFQRAMQHINEYVDRGVPFSAWLYRIAHNLVANWHRDRGRRKVVALDDFVLTAETHSNAPEETAQSSEEQHLLLKAIRRLPEDRQQLLILKFVERMSNAQIGAVMNRTEGAIKSLYHRTLIGLRDDFASYDSGIDSERKARRKRRKKRHSR